MKQRVFITRKIPESTLKKIRDFCDVEIWDSEDTPVPREILAEKIAEVDGLYCLVTDQIDSELISRAKKVKVISNMAVGFNNIDVKAATERGILVTNTPGVLTETTADLTFSLLMVAARRITEAAEFLKMGEWKTWAPTLLTGQDIYGATLGIIGLGRIGEAVAKRARGFSMNILYYNRNRKRGAEETLGVTYTSLHDLLKQSDYVVVMTPYTPETRNLLTSEHFKIMKKNAILINTARGGIVNEADLYKALKEGELWAAGLDVFEEEPLSKDHPLLTLPNVVALPHIGSASIETRKRMANVAANNLLQILAGKTSENLVNQTRN